MAADIQNPEISRILSECLGLQGRVSPGLEEFVVPTFQVADARLSSYICKSRSATAQLYQAAVVGQRPTAVLTAPPGVVAMITHIWAFSAVDAPLNMTFSQNNAALGSVATKSYTDQRLITAGETPGCQLTYGTQVAAITPVQWQHRMQEQVAGQGATLNHDPVNWVVGGDTNQSRSISFQAGTTNQSFLLTVEWVEYTALR